MNNVVLSTRHIDDLVQDIANAVINKIKDWNVVVHKTDAEKLHYPKKEAAELLSCSVPMIDKLVQQGRLDKVKVGAKVLITADSIDRILNNKKGAKNAR